jgi:hypothetical protein
VQEKYLPDLRVTRITTLTNSPDQDKDKCSGSDIVGLYQSGLPACITHATFKSKPLKAA